MVKKTQKRKNKTGSVRLNNAHLDRLVEEAIVDRYNESEQATGLYTMIEEHLSLPFATTVLGVPVTVERVQLTLRDEIVAVCRRARTRQTVRLLDLPLPSPPPAGSEWIDRKSTRLNSSHVSSSYAVFCLKKKSHKPNSSHQILRCTTASTRSALRAEISHRPGHRGR